MKLILAALLATGAFAHAEYGLVDNNKKVLCYGDDNQSWELNKKRTTIKFTVEGETLGPKKIIDTETDGKTYMSYKTEEGVLTLGKKDTWQFVDESEAYEVDCR